MNALLAHFFLANVSASKAAVEKLEGDAKTAKLLEIFTAIDPKQIKDDAKQRKAFNLLFGEAKQAMSEMMNAQVEDVKNKNLDENTLTRVMLLYLGNAKKLDMLA